MFRQTLLLLALMGTIGFPVQAKAEPQAEWTRTLYVANNAVDSKSCGAKTSPCRSISQAIDNARNGDRIVVGPGRYGDLNADGDFDDPGDEAAEVFTGCRCMILIDKRLKLESTDGAKATVLDAAGAVLDVVNITANGVVFGGDGKGFTLTGAGMVTDDDGLGLDILAARDVRVIDNIAQGNQDTGFRINGNRQTARKNFSIGNRTGFDCGSDAEGNTIKDNVALANIGNGFAIFGLNDSVVENRSIGNRGQGFLLLSTDASGFEFEENEAIGNRGAGIWVQVGSGFRLRENAFFGNLGEPFAIFPAAPNCGVVNDTGNTVDATRNYWGAPTGPGPDPADDGGRGTVCDRNGRTLVTPFDPTPSLLPLAP
ncbi:right-handed parallel beta-helix repeat-containing protein [Pyxidicoccus parkwayensis]|uniref:Right-handed parallel beta-helix repeat-containing protein n=1 Tax=Pyxidicoccus parkwayensis TaxID=2813578 RepID=A0ABX7NV06_9BACT|nr:right-handed parallel beta-helix repeat-containing protein [Pyxidicoccus parkwaysis]QSQ22757.1 right-handed parallel beta-helix repeat-containing protein [Pyxidicoccus parkwaysis]